MQKLRLFTLETYTNFMTMDHQMFRQTIFKLLHTINNSIPIKTKPFQQQQHKKSYGNRSTYSKEMTGQLFKNDFDVVL